MMSDHSGTYLLNANEAVKHNAFNRQGLVRCIVRGTGKLQTPTHPHGFQKFKSSSIGRRRLLHLCLNQLTLHIQSKKPHQRGNL